jgi:phosphate-selective porin OprO/OprP
MGLGHNEGEWGRPSPRIFVSFHRAKLWLMMVCACAAWPSVALASDPRIDELARQLRDVQSQLSALKAPRKDAAELKALQDATAAQMAEIHKKMDAQTHVSMPNGRFSAVSSDGAFSLALRATVQFDAGYFSQGRNPASVDLNSGTNFRRAQFGLVGTAWRDWAYNFTYDFGGNGTENRGYLYRAYIEYDGLAPLGFRVGAFSAYDSVEDATGGANLAFMERPTAVTVARSIGAGSGREGAEVFAQGERYLVSLALTGGKTTDAATFDEQQALVGRVAWLAVDRSVVRWLLNVDATHVFKLADVTAGPAPSSVIALSAGPELSIDASRTVDTGALDARHVTEFGMETALNLGRLFGQGGWFHYDIERRSAVPDPNFQGWYAMASWSLSGETRPYDPATASFHGLIPDAPLGKNGFGAWEVAARYSNMDLDFRPGGAGGVAGGVQNIWSIGLNWYPNPTVRFLLDYNNIHVSHANAPANDISANAIALRSQIAL